MKNPPIHLAVEFCVGCLTWLVYQRKEKIDVGYVVRERKIKELKREERMDACTNSILKKERTKEKNVRKSSKALTKTTANRLILKNVPAEDDLV